MPKHETKPCIACDEPIVFARENGKIRNKQPAIVALDPVPVEGGKWMLSTQGDHYYAGKLKSNQAAGARERGQELHAAHNDTCAKKDEYIRKRRSWNQ